MTGWRKSSYSNPSGNCVEALLTRELARVRDSKDPGGLVLEFTPKAWAAFLAYLKADRCPDCEGRGRVRLYARSRWEPCGLCAGKGRMTG